MTDNYSQPVSPGGFRGGLWCLRLAIAAGVAVAFVYGGPVTRVAAVSAGFFALLGDLEGGVRNLFRMIAFAAAVWAAPVIGAPAGDYLAAKTGLAPGVASGVGLVGSGIVVFVVMGALGRFASSQVRRSRTLGRLDSAGGGILGAAEGSLVVAGLCWALLTFQPQFNQLRERLHAQNQTSMDWVFTQLDSAASALQSDPAGEYIARTNPLPEMPMIKKAQEMLETAVNQSAAAHSGKTLPSANQPGAVRDAQGKPRADAIRISRPQRPQLTE